MSSKPNTKEKMYKRTTNSIGFRDLTKNKSKNKLNSIKSLSVKHRLIPALFAISLAMFSVSLLEKKPITKISLNNFNSAIKTTKSTSGLESQFKFVDRHNVQNSKGTVIFIPQIHKEPTTDASDPKNDRAEIIQKEMYSMLNELVNENDVKLVMDETDLYGPLPQDKVTSIQETLKLRDEFKSKLEQTLSDYISQGGSKETADSMRDQANKKIATLDRNLFLTGSAAVLEATNPNATVYGSQNEETINEARRQLQNIVFMENRIAQLEGSVSNTKPSQSSTITQSEQIKRLLAQIGQKNTQKDFLRPIQTLAAQNQNESLTESAKELEIELKNLLSKTNFETKSTSSNPQVKNPYSSVTNLSKLKKEYNIAYDKFMLLAKDKRSQEAADNTIKMLEENNQSTGILVLGAQHKDQLIEAFNKQGYNVIVITPESEINLNS